MSAFMRRAPQSTRQVSDPAFPQIHAYSKPSDTVPSYAPRIPAAKSPRPLSTPADPRTASALALELLHLRNLPRPRTSALAFASAATCCRIRLRMPRELQHRLGALRPASSAATQPPGSSNPPAADLCSCSCAPHPAPPAPRNRPKESRQKAKAKQSPPHPDPHRQKLPRSNSAPRARPPRSKSDSSGLHLLLLSPVPAFKKISSRPLIGAVRFAGACTVK